MATVGFSQDNALPLVADIQYMEPYASSALNRKFKNILLAGFYSGFIAKPADGLNLLISSSVAAGGLGTGTASIDTNGFQVTVQQNADVTLALTAGKSFIIAVQADYKFGVITNQVDANSTVKASQIVVLDIAATLAANQIELCRVVIPAGTKQITAPMISTKYRIDRLIGITLSDRIDLADSNTGASAYAVKLGYEAAVKYANENKAALGVNADITALNAVTSLGTKNISVGGVMTFKTGLVAAGGAQFSVNAYTDPYPDRKFAIKASDGVAIGGDSYFNDALTVKGLMTASNGAAVSGGFTTDKATITGQVVGAMPSRSLPANTVATWFKIARIDNAGSGAGWLNLLLSGGNYGSSVIGTDILSLSGRGLPATGTAFSAALAALYVQHIQIMTAGLDAPVIGVVANIESGVYKSLDFYIKSPKLWNGATLSVTGGAGYTYYGDDPAVATKEPTGIFYITPSAVLTSLSASYNLSQADMSLKSLALKSALTIANGGTGATTAADARKNLELGSAALAEIGTSGKTVPLLNTANTFTQQQVFSDGLQLGGEIISYYPNSLRMITGGVGAIWRNDGGSLYMLTSTESGGLGAWNGLLPFAINLNSGVVSMQNGQSLGGGTSITGDLSLTKALTVANGGTGAKTAVDARKNLELGSAALMTTSGATFDKLSGATTEAASTAQLVGLRNAAALTAQVNTFADVQKFTAGVGVNDGVNFGLFAGDGGEATYDSYGLRISSWWGVGFYDTSSKKTNIVFNLRTGDVSTKGMLTAASMTIGGKASISDDLTLTKALTVANGGTGATTPLAARKNLELGSAALMTTSNLTFDKLSGSTTEAASTAQLVGLRGAAALTGQVNTFTVAQKFSSSITASSLSVDKDATISGVLSVGSISSDVTMAKTLNVASSITSNYRLRIVRSDGYVPYIDAVRSDIIAGTPPATDTQAFFLQARSAGSATDVENGNVLGVLSIYATNVGGGKVDLQARNSAGSATSRVIMNGDAGYMAVTGDVQLAGSLTTNINAVQSIPSPNSAVSGLSYVPKVSLIGNSGNGETLLGLQGYNYTTVSFAAGISATRSMGAIGAHGQVPSGRNVFTLMGSASDGAAYQTVGRIDFYTSEATTGTSSAGEVRIYTTPTKKTAPTLAATFASDSSLTVAGNISTPANVLTTADNTMIRCGNNGDIGFVKTNNSKGRLGIGSANTFIVAASDATAISPADSWKTIFQVSNAGDASVIGALDVTNGATVGGSLTVSGLIYSGTMRANQYIDLGQQNTVAGSRMITFYSAGSTTATGTIKVVGNTTSDSTMTLNAGTLAVTADMTVSGTTTFAGPVNFNGIMNANKHDSCIAFSSSDSTKPIINANYSSAGNFGFWDGTNGNWVLRKDTSDNWYMYGALSVATSLAVGGAATVTGALVAKSGITTTTLNATGAATLGSLTVNGGIQSAGGSFDATLTMGYRGILTRDAAIPYLTMRRQDVMAAPTADTEIGRLLFGYGMGATDSWGTGGQLAYVNSIALAAGGGQLRMTALNAAGAATAYLALDGNAGTLTVTGDTQLKSTLWVAGNATLAGGSMGTNRVLTIGKQTAGAAALVGATQYVVVNYNNIGSDATSRGVGFVSEMTVGDGKTTQTLGEWVDFWANSNTVNANATVTLATGFRCYDYTNTAVASAYSFDGRLMSRAGTTRFNLFMQGSAPNYLRGQTIIGGTDTTLPNTGVNLLVNGRQQTVANGITTWLSPATADSSYYIRGTKNDGTLHWYVGQASNSTDTVTLGNTLGGTTFTLNGDGTGGCNVSAMTFGGSLSATGAVSVGSSLTVSGAAVLSNSLTVAGAITGNGGATLKSLAVTGVTTLSGSLIANGALQTTAFTATSSATIGGVLTANGGITTTAITASGVSYFNAELRAKQYIDIGPQNTTAGARELSFYAAGNNTTLSGKISVAGTTMSLQAGGVNVTGALSVGSSLTVSGVAVFSSEITVAGNANINGSLVAKGNLYAGDALMQTDGNIKGNVWGGYLNNYIADKFNSAYSLSNPPIMALYAVGSYIFATTSAQNVAAGTSVAGSALFVSNAQGANVSTSINVGTWRCLGNIGSTDNNSGRTVLWQRIG